MSRRQGQIIDLDPTDGLPVQKYAFQVVQINQDASADAAAVNTKSTNSAEWAAQFKTPQYPWAEAPLPSFQKELQPWNQEMIRRARAGNTNAKLSVWDRKNHVWMSASEAGKRATPLKSLHLNNLESNGNSKMTNGDADSTKSDNEESEDSSNDSSKSGDEDDEDEGAPFKTSATKRRKLASRMNEPDDTRTIEVRKWVQLPPTVAEKAPERTFLAPRRLGMPPLYTPDYAQKLFGQYHSSVTLSGATGYDLGEGGGLNNASGVLAAGTANATAGTATPPRKNIPPRRKKKKLGGPGRKKANPNPEPVAQAMADPASAQAGVVGENQSGAEDPAGAAGAQGQTATNEAADANADNEVGADGDDNESGSEAEGSEEGEIDESGGANAAHEKESQEEQRQEEPPVAVTAPEVTVTDTEMQEIEPPVSAEAIDVPEASSERESSHVESKANAEMFIPGLGEVEDEEEKQIVEENAQALEPIDPSADALPDHSEAISEAMKEIVAPDTVVEESTVPETVMETVSETVTAPEAEEMDLLGAMDAAIDRGMSEGA